MGLCEQCFNTRIGATCTECGQAFDPDLKFDIELDAIIHKFIKQLIEILGEHHVY